MADIEVRVKAFTVDNVPVEGIIGTDQLADDAVTAPKIKDGEVGSDELGPLAVTAAKLAVDAVEELKIKAGAVTGPKIADNAVGTGKLVDGAVLEAKVQSKLFTKCATASGVNKVKQVGYDVNTNELILIIDEIPNP